MEKQNWSQESHMVENLKPLINPSCNIIHKYIDYKYMHKYHKKTHNHPVYNIQRG